MKHAIQGFTLIELMIVVVIVSILALVAIPMYSGNVINAKMSEGIAGCGTVRTAARVYLAGHGGKFLAPIPTLSGLGFNEHDLDGKFFNQTSYSFTAIAGTANYTVEAKLVSDPTWTYKLDQDGTELGSFKTGQ